MDSAIVFDIKRFSASGKPWRERTKGLEGAGSSKWADMEKWIRSWAMCCPINSLFKDFRKPAEKNAQINHIFFDYF